MMSGNAATTAARLREQRQSQLGKEPRIDKDTENRIEACLDCESLDQTMLEATANTRSFHLHETINSLFVFRQFKLNFLLPVMSTLT